MCNKKTVCSIACVILAAIRSGCHSVGPLGVIVIFVWICFVIIEVPTDIRKALDFLVAFFSRHHNRVLIFMQSHTNIQPSPYLNRNLFRINEGNVDFLLVVFSSPDDMFTATTHSQHLNKLLMLHAFSLFLKVP